MLDLTGNSYGRWTVLGGRYTSEGKTLMWKCRCSCGTVKDVAHSNLRGGRSISCGCNHREQLSSRSTTHGMSKTDTYKIWHGILKRCYNPKSIVYEHYGERGITVCDRWRARFLDFLSDMGERPSKEYSIERIDNDGNYCPENCKWATDIEQLNNTTRNVRLSAYGKSLTQMQWQYRIGISRTMLRKRRLLGMQGGILLAPSAHTRNYKGPLCVRMLETYTPQELAENRRASV